MNGYSQSPKDERIEKLKAIMPEIFDEGKIDWEKLRAVLGDDVDIADERYRLNWAGKSDAFRVMQEPSSATFVPYLEESVDFDNTQNIFIEGENMEVLKVLQKSYFGKVKMIYIDPPYNTGNDSFIYPDRFAESREEYMRRVGDKDDDGYMLRDGMFRKNSKENGQYHSNWLNMMMPRLYLAKSLLVKVRLGANLVAQPAKRVQTAKTALTARTVRMVLMVPRVKTVPMARMVRMVPMVKMAKMALTARMVIPFSPTYGRMKIMYT